MAMSRFWTLMVFWLAGLYAAAAYAAVIEETIQVPLHGVLPNSIDATVPVLVVRPDDRRSHLLALILHGRGVDELENQRMGRVDFPANARYLAARGYAVLIPTRIGYGIAAGPKIEDTGPCDHKAPHAALRAAAAEMKAVVSHASSAPWAKPRDAIAIGDSFGGLIALALAADPPQGLSAVVNVAGGDGGDSLRHVDAPCDPLALSRELQDLGAAAQVPVLFLYSANDRFWGPSWPRRWFEAWHHPGHQNYFVELPADKNNGHFIFNRNAESWHAPFEAFLRDQHLP
jgi:dienelactone hydrolase